MELKKRADALNVSWAWRKTIVRNCTQSVTISHDYLLAPWLLHQNSFRAARLIW